MLLNKYETLCFSGEIEIFLYFICNSKILNNGK